MSRSLSGRILEKYKTRYFVETGSYTGGGISAALKMGFEHIISIENDKILYDACVRRYKDRTNVKLIYGDSALKLEEVLRDINEQAFVFLDAHSEDYNPILKELEALKNCHFNSHIILIDDKREFNRGVWPGITVEMLVDKLLEINPNYVIRYEDSSNARGDIITAWVEQI